MKFDILYAVVACVDFEGCTPLFCVGTKDEAQKICDDYNKLLIEQPVFRAAFADNNELANHFNKMEAEWLSHAPIEFRTSFESCDYFKVSEIKVVKNESN